MSVDIVGEGVGQVYGAGALSNEANQWLRPRKRWRCGFTYWVGGHRFGDRQLDDVEEAVDWGD